MTLRRRLYCGAPMSPATPLFGCVMDLDRRNKCQQPRDAMLFGRSRVKAGNLSGSDGVRMEFGSVYEEVVPDSDDEKIGRRQKLWKGVMVGGESIGLGSQRPIVNDENEEHGIVLDSEDDRDEGRRRVMISYKKVGTKKLGCLNVPQQQGESSRANALKFTDHFSKCNDLDLSSEGKSSTKGVNILARTISNCTPAVGFRSYDWTDRETNKQGMLYKKSYVLFYSRRKKRCAVNKPVITAMKFVDDNICSVSSYQQEGKEVTDLSCETNDEAQVRRTWISGSEKVENLTDAPETLIGNNGKDSDVQMRSKLNSVAEEGVTETFDDIFNTQMAAEVIEMLSLEPPKRCNSRDSSQTIITDYRIDFNEKEARLGYSSSQNESYPGRKQNGDRLKRTKGESGSHKSAFHEDDGAVEHDFSTGKEDMICNEKNITGKLFPKTVMERTGCMKASECINKVFVEPHLIPFVYKACRGFETKFTASPSPVRWISKAQQSFKPETRDGAEALAHTCKRRRSAMVRKKNMSPYINTDPVEVKSNAESKKEYKSVSNVISDGIASNTLIFRKGKRTSRGSSNLRHFNRIGNVGSEDNTEKEVKTPLPKIYKPANHCDEPAWVKYPRKRRTSAASKKQEKGRDSCEAKASWKSSSYCTELMSCGERDAGKNAILDNSNNVPGFYSLSAVSSNSSIVPQLSAKMPKSSLIRELTGLGGFSDIPLDSSCKNLRRRKHMANIRVLLSQHLDSDTIMQQKKVLARLGITTATSASDATHFVTSAFSRTKNMLEAIALGKPIVTQLWLESCAEAGCLVDEKSYILKDLKKEKEIGFSLSASLAKAARHPLLKGCKVFFTPNIKPDKSMLSSLVKMVQGEVVEKLENNQTPEDVIVLSCEEDYAICMPFLKKGTRVYHSELLLNGIVTQKLDLQRHQLFQDRAKGPPPRTLKNSTANYKDLEDRSAKFKLIPIR